MQDREERLMSLAAEALRTSAIERENFLRAACEQDEKLYSEVTEIVKWEERMGDFMRDPLISLIDLEKLDRPFHPKETVSDRFEIIREVGDGGMGVVYEAYDREREERIAIKCAKLGFENLPPELKKGLRVRHRNACQVNEIHTVKTGLGKLYFLTMEFLDGETLLDRLQRGKMAHEEALDIAHQLCAGLAEAHRSGVLHRDLKPANVILCPEKSGTRAVITDFGLAVDEQGNTELLGGTPSYMAPELRPDGKSVPASDVYALGVILYEMVTGQKPFPPNADGEVKVQEPEPPSKRVKDLPKIWDKAILPCLNPQPEKRPSANQIIKILDRKSIYQNAWLYAAASLLVVLGLIFSKPLYNALRTADIRLTILPVQSADSPSPSIGQALDDLAQRVAQQGGGDKKLQVISPAEAQKKGVTDTEQAKRVLNANRVLEVKTSNDGNGISVNAAIINTETGAHIHDYSAHFTASDLHDLPGGLAGLVSTSLHLPHAPQAIAPAAATAYNSGLGYLRQGRYSYDEAITQFNEAKRLDPDSPLPYAGLAEAHVNKSRVLGDSKELDEAEANVISGEKLDPDSPQVRIASSIINILRNRNAQALEDCRRALDLEPKNTDAWLRCGYADEIQGLADKALDEYHKAAELDPRYFRPYQYIGGFYAYRGRFSKAEPFYRKEVEYAENDMDGYSDLGGALTEEAKFSDAEKVYKTALQIKKNSANLNNLGGTYAYEGRDADALLQYSEAVRMEPANFRYWMNIGDSERRLGHIQAASAAYQKTVNLTRNLLKINPDSGSTRAFLAYSLARLGRKEDAENEIVQALQSATADNQLIRNAVFTYEVLGERDLALKAAAQLTPEARNILQHHPDLADFRQDSRFKQLLASSQ